MSNLRANTGVAVCLLSCCLLNGCSNVWHEILPGNAPDFLLSVTPSTQTTTINTVAAFTAQITPQNGFSSPVTLVLLAPTGVLCAEPACTIVVPAGTASGQFHVSSANSGTFTLPVQATSGTRTHTVAVTLTVVAPSVPDFAFAVSPTASTLVAGANTPAYSFTVMPINGFASPVTITASAPSGFSCLQSPCSITSSAASIPNALSFSTLSSLVPSTYTLTFTATAGTLTHTATATLGITLPTAPLGCSGNALVPTTPISGTNAYIDTGDAAPPAALYDSIHNVIFASNLQLGEVDLISPNDLSILLRIPLADPLGLDLSTDGSTLIVGSATPYFYTINTNSLCVMRHPGPGSILGSTYTPSYPFALADGSLVFSLLSPSSGGAGLVRWTPAGGFVNFFGSPSFSSASTPARSGDHEHLFFGSGQYPVTLNRYDVVTGTFTAVAQAAGSFVGNILAVNQDGSHVYALINSTVTLLDANFNPLASYAITQSTVPGYLYTPATNRLYVNQSYYPETTVLDAGTLDVVGYLPVPLTQSGALFGTALGAATYNTIDGAGRVITPTVDGLELSVLGQPLAQSPAVNSEVSVGQLSGNNAVYGTSVYTGFSVAGGSANTPGATATPTSVVFAQGTLNQNALFSQVSTIYGPDQIDLTVPTFSGACADLTVGFNVGVTALVPRAFCFGPQVEYADGDSGPSIGGGTLTLYGKGFGPHPVVKIGGVNATIVSAPTGFVYSGIAPETVVATVPPGTPGSATITVSNGSSAAATLAQSYTYYTLTQASLPSNAAPYQIVYDAPRNRLLWTDSARNLLVVSSPSTGQTLQQITVGHTPWGLSVSPDGSRIAIANSGDATVGIYDGTSFALLQSVTIPTVANTPYTPIYTAIMSNGIVLITVAPNFGLQGGYGFPALYGLNLATSVLTSLQPGNNIALGCENIAEIASTADGTQALVAGYLYNSSTGKFTLSGGGCTQVGISADGFVSANGSNYFSNAAGQIQNYYDPPWLIASKLNRTELNFANSEYMAELTLNASGSLSFSEFATSYFGIHPTNQFRIWDVQHGTLLRTAIVPGSFNIQFGCKIIAADPEGQRLWTFTTAGHTELQFQADPLSVGEAQYTPGNLTLLGSGFAPSLTVQIDNQVITPVTVTGTTTATIPLPTLGSGSHQVTVSLPGGSSYVLPVAFTTP